MYVSMQAELLTAAESRHAKAVDESVAAADEANAAADPSGGLMRVDVAARAEEYAAGT